jgi:hypothetical protein
VAAERLTECFSGVVVWNLPVFRKSSETLLSSAVFAKKHRGFISALFDSGNAHGVVPRCPYEREVAAKAGCEANGGGFNNALGRLRTVELVQGRGELPSQR